MLVVHVGVLLLLCTLNHANDSLENGENDGNTIDDVRDNKNKDLDKEHDTDSDENDALSWDEYFNSLLNVTKLQFNTIKNNVRRNYKLDLSEIKATDALLNDTNEYEFVLQHNLKKMSKVKKFNATYEFMIDFMDLSNVILEKILDMKLSTIDGKLKVPTKWYQQSFKDKIVRQETKIAVYNIENYICATHLICKDNYIYTDYIKEWIRLLLNEPPRKLKQFFNELPKALNKHKHTLKSNANMLDKMKSILDYETVVRDVLDFVDEVITNKNNIVKICPEAFKKCATLLIQLFQEINLIYNMNEQNADRLDEVTKMIHQWRDGRDVTLKLFDNVIENMNTNFKIWPLKVQYKIDSIWFDIITL